MDVKNAKTVQTSARTVEEAVQKALEQLDLDRDEAEVEIVKQGSRGLLGLLSEDAVVRVSPKQAPATAAVRRKVEPEPTPVRSQAEEPVEEPAEALEGELEGSALPETMDVEEVGLLGAQVLQRLLDGMGIAGRVEREAGPPRSPDGPPSVVLNITGDDLGLLIGRRGETLRDLQFMTCLITSRQTHGWPILTVDVEHYRLRREKSLIDLAHRMADRVRTSSQPVSLEPMPPAERRIVHMALKDDPDVRTESTGQDEGRKVVIYPK